MMKYGRDIINVNFTIFMKAGASSKKCFLLLFFFVFSFSVSLNDAMNAIHTFSCLGQEV